jgi:hypothetical protein
MLGRGFNSRHLHFKGSRKMIIGLSGWARAGKDTVADHLVDSFGFVKLSFATPMREALVRLNPMIRVAGYPTELASAVRLMGWENLKSESPDVRGLMQRLGTEVGREMFGDDFWVKAAINAIPEGANVVFSDVRYPNEANAVRALGGKVWRVYRDGIGPANGHTSENALGDYSFDAGVENFDTLEELHKTVDNLIKEI